MQYSVKWISDDSFMILKRESTNIELGAPMSKHEELVQLVREVIPNRQGITIGCQINNLTSPYWNWLTLSMVMTEVFGFQIINPLIAVLKACPTEVMAELYRGHHGKEIA